MNQGFPTAVTFAIDTVLGDILKRHGAVMDMPMGANAPNTYVAGRLWAPELSGAQPRGGRTAQVEPQAQRLWARVVRPVDIADTMPDLQEESDDEESLMDIPPPNGRKPNRERPVRRDKCSPAVPVMAHPVWLTD